MGQGDARNDQIEMAHHLLDRAVAEQSHADHDPRRILGGQFAPPHRHRAACLQGLLDPVVVEALREQGKALLVESVAGLDERLPEIHPHPSFCPSRLKLFRAVCACGRRTVPAAVRAAGAARGWPLRCSRWPSTTPGSSPPSAGPPGQVRQAGRVVRCVRRRS